MWDWERSMHFCAHLRPISPQILMFGESLCLLIHWDSSCSMLSEYGSSFCSLTPGMLLLKMSKISGSSLNSAVAPGFGLVTMPRKRGVWETSSTMAKMNGMLTAKIGIVRTNVTEVAAEASAPSSFSSMLEACCTPETARGPTAIPDRSGPENSVPKPGQENQKSQM